MLKMQRATIMISCLRNLSYERIGDIFFETEEIYGDMIEVFKMIHGIDNVNLGKPFGFSFVFYVIRDFDIYLYIIKA